MFKSYSFTWFRTFCLLWIKALTSPAFHRSARALGKLKDSKRGKKAIILCNGPSLKNVDLNQLLREDVETFGLNKINLLFEDTRFRPTYLVCINRFVVEQNAEYFKQTNIPLFVDSRHVGLLDGSQAIPLRSLPMRGFFGRDVSKGYCQGFTVTYAAMQLAYHMGFDNVALVGCDHYFNDKGTPNAVVESQSDDTNHFHPDYFGKGMKWQLPDIVGSEFHYQIARDEFKSAGKSLYNCTEGGHLHLLERISLSEFLAK